ncbi:MAG: glycoside hydrolase family 3 C-terminal domain-containing protein [Myxococcota bacterium]|jgi:beta-glucosidase|nr:glycosyl hydrolase [Deltaproteobacteria bacterium]MCP4243834.1 beta-glucosidase [bacterium]MDP6075561.1 glycoside hydrolase family 3 C-terminal domain-containing protein [Myxococcota bacterium]MDP6244758.1 glycoside hydrolase family 3 C-terminal domain-containing protein [Myxococcota bacterium]MDP7076515.1 glycoside hydrolase family 3 C-terminal domain-containing protein [Myxococcota bacterium]
MSLRIDDLLGKLSVEEKADLVTGLDMWRTRPVERLGLASMKLTDGPNGARGDGLMGTGTETACIPCAAVLGATWDADLVERLGRLLGDESRAKGASVLLAPTINLHRSPLGGRNFECYAEDPVLSGRLAAAFVRGVQSRGVATTPKHFVANDSEFERNTIDVQVDERTLREVYLVPFECAVKEGGAWGVMSAYNRLNGVFCSEQEWLLQRVLRQDWGFDGFVVSDWFAVRSTAESVRAGLSLEMPGPGRFYGREGLTAALDAGDIGEAELDSIVGDMLRTLERTGLLGGGDAGSGVEERRLDRAEDRALCRQAAAAGTVLLANDGSLPLDPDAIGSLAVIGPNARLAKVMGGGSAAVRAYRAVSPLEALEARLGDRVDVRYARGCDIDRSTPTLASPFLDGELAVAFHEGFDLGGDPVASMSMPTGRFLFFGEPAPGVPVEAFSFRASGRILPTVSGPHALRIVQSGRTRVFFDGAVVLDATEGEYARGDEFFGLASEEIEAVVELEAGRAAEIAIEYSNRDSVFLSGLRVGLVSLVEEDLLGEAEALAAECDVALLVVGTNDDWETEGRDRDQFALPGDQPELIRRVAAANPRTVVAVNTGGIHALDWLDAPAAVLQVGFGGQELGEALVDVLVGDVDPGGRMPTSVPVRYEHHPALLNYPGENSVVRYGEGLFMGHRWYDVRGIDPAVAFGHGLSYASFSWSAPRAPSAATTGLDAPVVVEIDVTNTSDRAGWEVVQLYIEPPEARLQRPIRELKGFDKLHLEPGETKTARIELGRRAFAYFDTGDRSFEALAEGMPVPAGSGPLRLAEAGWCVEPGVYRLVLGRSSRDPVASVALTLSGEETHEPA